MADEPQTPEGASVPEHVAAAPPLAPPTVPDHTLAHRPPPQTWAMVAGVLGILISVYAMFMGLSGVIMLIGFGRMQVTVASGSATTATSMQNYMSAAGWDYVCTGVLAGLLLPGSIGLLMRRRWAWRFVVGWAALKIIAAGVFGVMISRGFSEMMQATAAQSKAATPMPAGMASTMSAVMAVFWGVMACIIPALALIWFARGTIRAQMRAWA